MPAAQRKTTNPVFGQNETMDDLTAEREELGGGEVASQGPLALPPPSEDVSPPTSEATPPVEPASTEQAPEKETRADRRIRELLDRNQQYERQLAESNERWARLDERSKQVREARSAAEQAAQAAQRPDPGIDPVGAKLWDLEKQNTELLAWRQQQEQQFQQLQQGFQADQQNNQFNNWVVSEANAYSRQQPDYIDAARHAAEWRMGWWQKLGCSPDEARTMVMNEANLLTRLAAQKNVAFAPVVYELAKQVGYQPRGGNGNGVTPAAASQAGKVLSQVAKGQAMQGIGRAPGAGNEARSRYASMTAAEIASVPDNVWQRDYANPQLRAEMEAALRRLDGVEDQDVRYGTR